MNQAQPLRQSKDNFYKKVSSSKGFQYQSQSKAQTYSTMIQILKSDLIQLQDMIISTATSSDIKKFQLLSVTPGLSNKLNEIVKAPKMNDIIEKIEKDSLNVEAIGKNYSCQSSKDLISKLYLEVNFNELLNRMLCDYFLLMKLKLVNDHTYQDSLSRILPIKEFIEKLMIKLQSGNVSPVSQSQSTIITETKNEKNLQIEKEYNEFLKIATLNEIIETNVTKNKLNEHCSKMVNQYFQNMNFSTNKFLMEINNGTNVLNKLKGNDVEKYFKLKEEIQSITKTLNNEVNKNKESMSSMINKDKEELSSMKINYENQIKELKDKLNILEQNNKDLNNKLTEASTAEQKTIQSNLKYTEEQYSSMVSKYQTEISQKENEYKNYNEKLNNSNKELSKQIESLKKELQSKDQEIQNIKSQKQTSTAKTSSNSNYNPNIQDIIKRHESEFKKIQNETSRKLDTEIKELNDKLTKITENYNTLKLENQSLKKQTDLFHSKNFNADSYEQVLLEQFETMKNAFVRKLEEVNEELNQTKSETRVKLYNMEQELKDTKRLKDVFLEQVVQLQKQLEN